MTTEGEVGAARDQALRKIGRNLVIFQKMEGMLKFLLTVACYTQPASKVSGHLSERSREYRSRPMGEIVERTARALKASPAEAPHDITEPWISFSISFEGEAWTINDWRRDMRLVVEERNHLVHHSASAVDLESLESCNAFSAQLDAQRERVMPSHQNLVEMVNVVRAYGRVMSDNIDEIVERLMAGAPSHDA